VETVDNRLLAHVSAVKPCSRTVRYLGFKQGVDGDNPEAGF